MKYYTVENKKKSILKTFAIYYICMAVFCIVRIALSRGNVPGGLWGDIFYSLIIQGVIMFALPLMLYSLMLRVRPKEVFESSNFYRPSGRVVLISIALGILCFVINIFISSIFSGILSFTGFRYYGASGDTDYSVLSFVVAIFTTAIMPAVCEEFLHRGILLQGVKHIGFNKAIVISSLLFALIHFNIMQTGFAFVVGLLLGFVSVVAKNIWPAIIMHFMNNFLSTYFAYAKVNNWPLGDLLNMDNYVKHNNMVVVFMLSAVIVLIVIGLLALCIWKLYKESIIRKVNLAIEKVYNSNSAHEKNSPINIGEQEVIRELLENNTLLNLEFQEKENPISYVMPKEKSRYQPRPLDKVFLWGGIILGGLITLFTYIWGLI